MSLKAFHLVFIIASIVLAFGFGAWLLRQCFAFDGPVIELAGGIASIVAGIGLIVNERYFLKKTRNVSYL